MNTELIVRYVLFLLQTRDLQWARVRVRVDEIAAHRHARGGRFHLRH
jgi:hypothetical protein